jgi:UDP-2-acetamido-3-amino-2,3-dideoxy-glucuronate N-acetyltransferase
MKKPKIFKHAKALISPKARIGEGTRVWAFANIQAGAVIGQGCNICDGCYIEAGSQVGNYVTLKNGVNVWQGIILEDDVFCGANTSFINDRLPRSHRPDQWILERTIVKKGATIGSNATILCGLTIGTYAFIGAGSVVTRDVPDYAIVVGNPAHYVGYACRCGKKMGSNYFCACGRKYVLDAGKLRPKD